MAKLSSRKGMAIVIALAFSFCLMILVFGMWVSQSNVARQNRSSLQTQQAYFAARAAVQHVLVKARLLPTEFYDGIAFSAGKNPCFSFTEFTKPCATLSYGLLKDRMGNTITGAGMNVYALYTNTGDPYEIDIKTRAPRFVYVQLNDQGKNNVFIRLGSYYNANYRFLSSSLCGFAGTKQYQEVDPTKLPSVVSDAERKKYLEFFTGDCNNQPGANASQSLLIMQKGTKARPKDWSIICDTAPLYYNSGDQKNRATFKTDIFPYTLEYKVNSISLAAMKELKKYGEEAIMIEVEGKIVDFKGETFVTKQNRTQKITRSGFVP